MEQMKSMGGLSKIMEMLPGMGMNLNAKNMPDMDESEKQMEKIQAIIRSMTMKERTNPDIIKLCQDYSVYADTVIEGSCHVNCFLSSHRIYDEQRLRNASCLFHIYKLLHHGFINLQTTCGIKDDHVFPLFFACSIAAFAMSTGL